MLNSTLLQLRWWQFRKECKGIGLFYVFLLLLLVFAATLGLHGLYGKGGKEASLGAGMVLLSVLALHLGRKDKVFVDRHMAGGYRNIFAEYLVLASPFSLPALFSPYPWLFALLMIGFFFIAKIKVDIRQRLWFGFLSRWIAPRDFEWLSGVRKNLPVLVLFYIASLSLCWLRIAPLVPLWIVTVIIASFYGECEPLHILKAEPGRPGIVIRAKLRRHLLLLIALSLPILLLHVLFYPSLGLINLAFMIAQCLLLSFALLLKYATYRPDAILTGNSLLLGLMAVAVLIPFLLPLPLLLNLRYYRKASANLKSYYHD